MKRCFITQQVPDSLVVKYNVSQAGVNFCNNLVSSNIFNQAFAIPLLSIVPDISDDFLKDHKYTYIQNRTFPHRKLGKALNAILENLRCVYKAAPFNHIWFYNLNKQTVFAYIVLRYILFKNVYILVADFNPGVKVAIKSFIEYLINHSKGIITLSSRTKFKNPNTLCLPGIVPKSRITKKSISYPERAYLLSGVLKEATGLSIAIEVFSKLPNQKLYISGIVDEKYLTKIKEYSNIIYHGYLEYDKYIDLVEKIPVGLSLRDPDLPVNANNFPSKILEYFTMGKVVLSTIDYPEIKDFHYFKCKYSVNGIAEMITKINNMSDNELMKYFNHDEQLNNNFSESAWMRTFDKIEGLA